MEATAEINERITALKTEAAALDAQRSTALTHIEDLRELRRAMEGDREKKQALVQSIQADTARLNDEIAALLTRQQENDAQAEEMKRQVELAISHRAET